MTCFLTNDLITLTFSAVFRWKGPSVLVFLINSFPTWGWWECSNDSSTVRLRYEEAKLRVSSPVGELFRWWDVDLQLWDLAKANVHLDLSGSIQLCSTHKLLPASFSCCSFVTAWAYYIFIFHFVTLWSLNVKRNQRYRRWPMPTLKRLYVSVRCTQHIIVTVSPWFKAFFQFH